MSLTAPLPVTDAASAHRTLHNLGRYGLVLALIVVFAIFSLTTSTFLTFANLQSVLVNNFTLLAIVSVAMTFAVASGGIDLSVGTAVDMASFAFVSVVLAGQPVAIAALAGLVAGGLVGAFNALLISGIGISPFLATLGTLFIGRSIQQMLTNGGNPVYLPRTACPLPSALSAMARSPACRPRCSSHSSSSWLQLLYFPAAGSDACCWHPASSPA